MTYWKKCGKKGKKLTTLILSLAMLGTSTAPSVRLLGQDIANVYADEDVILHQQDLQVELALQKMKI